MTEQSLLRVRYDLLRPLSESDASRTYEAHDSETGTRCVVKELSVGAVVRSSSSAASYDSDDFTKLVDLFEREARVLANLEHPAIPRFIDHFTEEVDGDTRLYTVQEFIEGDTLAALVEGGRHFTEEEAVQLCLGVVDILEYLHGRSPPLIHRDIKPSNIIVGPDGAPYLVDFGSVKNALTGDALEGKTIVGTYGYMPLEQYEARAVPQSDFYALGMTLVFLLSHREPTQIPRTGMTLEFREHVHVSERFAAVIEWMISAAPEDRPGDAAALRDALQSEVARGGELVARKSYLRSPWGVDVTSPGPRTIGAMSLVAFMLALVIVLLSRAAPFVPVAPDDDGVASTVTEVAGSGPRSTAPVGVINPIRPADGVLAIDVSGAFRYVATGFPMGQAATQTALPGLSSEPFQPLETPDWGRNSEALFTRVRLGDGADPWYDLAFVRRSGSWTLWVDYNNNEDLTDDGPPHGNEGTGDELAATVTVDIELTGEGGDRVRRPYGAWIWINRNEASVLFARFYAMHHYVGEVQAGDKSFKAVVFESNWHDGRYGDAGVCIDLNGDDECDEGTELRHDGDLVTFPSGTYTVRLDYP
jgi:serine/threonine protein kinase